MSGPTLVALLLLVTLCIVALVAAAEWYVPRCPDPGADEDDIQLVHETESGW